MIKNEVDCQVDETACDQFLCQLLLPANFPLPGQIASSLCSRSSWAYSCGKTQRST
jgi:hypothetical protein